MARNFIAGAVEHPGAAKRAAAREGLTVHEWAIRHRHDGGVTGRRARLALELERLRPKRRN